MAVRHRPTSRISKRKQAFEKGYLPGWLEEIFIITKKFPTTPVTYAIKDVADEEIKGRFYEPELQLIIKEDNVYDVEKVLRTRRRNGNSLYVYCDAAEAIAVGDIKGPLLRVVDAAGNVGDLIYRLYTTPQYGPVSRKEFNTVEIDIRDDTGSPVPFEFGKVVATLHYR